MKDYQAAAPKEAKQENGAVTPKLAYFLSEERRRGSELGLHWRLASCSTTAGTNAH